jgi:hypothetical protein
MSPQTFAKLSKHLASLDERGATQDEDGADAVDEAVGTDGLNGAEEGADHAAEPEEPDPWYVTAGAQPSGARASAGGSTSAAQRVRTNGSSGGSRSGSRGYGSSRSGSSYSSSGSGRLRRPRSKYGASRKRMFKRRSRTRTAMIWLAIAGGALLIAFVAIVATAYLHAYKVYGTLKEVPGHVTAARKVLQQGHLPQTDDLETANGLAHDAQEQIADGGFAFSFTKSLPMLGRPIKAISLAADAASEETDAAELVKGMILRILGPGGGTDDSTSPVFQNGVINVGLLQQVTPTLQNVVTDLQRGDTAIRAIPHIPFFSQLDDLKAQVLNESGQAVALSERALTSVRLLPAFLGADGPRTYYLALQNPADQRGTGGAVLAYAIIRIDNGKIEIAQSKGHAGAGPIGDIDPATPGFVDANLTPSALWYLRTTGVIHRLANGANYSPDFPSAAQSWSSMLTSGPNPIVPKVDGVIALDPNAVQAAFAGQSFSLPAIGETIASGDIAKFVTYDQYTLSKDQQRLVPGLLITAAFDQITHPKHLFDLLQTMSTALVDKDIQMWSADPQEQALVTRLGWNGAIANPAGGDYLNLSYDKRLGNKVDYFTQMHADYDVNVNASGGITSTYALGLSLPIPADLPPDIVGHFTPYGVDLAMLNLYVPGDAKLISYEPQADFDPNAIDPSQQHVLPRGFVQHTEGPFRVFTKTIMATPANPGYLRFHYSVPGVIKDTPQGKVYTLTVQHQPMSKPQTISVHLRLPAGFDIVSLGPGWTATSFGAVYNGTINSDFSTSVVFK